MGIETLAYTNPATGVTVTFGDASLPNVLYNGISGVGLPPVDNFVVDTAYQPGAQFVRTKKKPAVVTAHLIVQGVISTGVDARLSLAQTEDMVLSVIDPQIVTSGYLVKTFSDGSQRLLTNVQYVGGFEVKDQASNFAYVPIDLIFEGYDPTWYSVAPHQVGLGAASDPFGFVVPVTIPLTISGQATGTSLITNAGNIPSSPVFTFTGPCANYSISSQTTGESFAITQTLGAGDVLVVDCKQGVVTWTPAGGVSAQLYSAFGGARQFVHLSPGGNQLLFARDVGLNNQCVITWSDTWNHG